MSAEVEEVALGVYQFEAREEDGHRIKPRNVAVLAVDFFDAVEQMKELGYGDFWVLRDRKEEGEEFDCA